MPSLHIQYEIYEGVSVLLSIEKLTLVIKLGISFKEIYSLMGVSINLNMVMK